MSEITADLYISITEVEKKRRSWNMDAS